MSSLHKLKAYFGMVPADGYDADYDDYDELDGYDADGYAPARSGRGGELRGADLDRDRDLDRGRYERARDRGDLAAGDRRREPVLVGARSGGSDDDEPRSRPTRLDPLPAVGARRGGGAGPSTRGALAVDHRAEHRPDELRRDDGDGEDLSARITTVHPTDYAEAKVVGERFRAGNPVIINLTRMSDADAKRLVDFSAGLAFAMRGSIDKVTTKVFLLSPASVEFSDEDRRRLVADGFYNH